METKSLELQQKHTLQRTQCAGQENQKNCRQQETEKVSRTCIYKLQRTLRGRQGSPLPKTESTKLRRDNKAKGGHSIFPFLDFHPMEVIILKTLSKLRKSRRQKLPFRREGGAEACQSTWPGTIQEER